MERIEKEGFNLSLSQIPLSKNGVIVNGAHRLATGVILSKEVYFQQLNYRFKVIWDFLFFLHMGLCTVFSKIVPNTNMLHISNFNTFWNILHDQEKISIH
jgi:hypothetical protein